MVHKSILPQVMLSWTSGQYWKHLSFKTSRIYSKKDIKWSEKSIIKIYVLLKYLQSFLKIGEHNNLCYIFLPYHKPMVRHCILFWSFKRLNDAIMMNKNLLKKLGEFYYKSKHTSHTTLSFFTRYAYHSLRQEYLVILSHNNINLIFRIYVQYPHNAIFFKFCKQNIQISGHLV